MEVKIGIQNTQRELTVNVDGTAEELADNVRAAVSAKDGVLSLTDTKGRLTLVPGATLAYIEVGPSVEGKVGFRS